MTYKSIVTALTDKDQSKSLLPLAIQLANSQDAHLDVHCLGVDHSQTGYAYGGINALILHQAFEMAQEKAEETEVAAIEVLNRDATRFGTVTGVVQMADINRRFAERARFSDLAILSKPYIKDTGPELEALVESALFDGRTPVLVVPLDKPFQTAPKRVLLAWNESNEALRAAKAALPFLQQADEVHIAIIDPPQHGPDRSDPGGPLAQMLSRHGVHCEIAVLGRSMTRVSEILLRHQKDIDAEMIVMGAYGHSRLREAILGGATRNMLEQADVPVFMAH